MSWRVVGVVVTAWVVALALLLPGSTPTPAATAPAQLAASTERAELRDAVAVLAEWDDRRADAWAAGDATALRALYAAGSSAGAADVALLGRWEAAGWRVEGLTSQLLAAEVVRSAGDRIVLRVVDRVAGGQVISADAGRTTTLPGTTAAARTVDLRLGPAGWQVASVRPAP